jgi:hypothetical protein
MQDVMSAFHDGRVNGTSFHQKFRKILMGQRTDQYSIQSEDVVGVNINVVCVQGNAVM